MRGTMMDFPLTITHLLERAGRLYGDAEIVSRLPDKSLHRHTYRDFSPPRLRAGRGVATARAESRRARGDADVEPLRAP